MAMYEYECPDCELTFEVIDMKNKGKDKPCPVCKRLCKKVEISQSNFHLGKTGVGWHKDGYNRPRSIADGPGGEVGTRTSGKTVIPVRNKNIQIEPDKDTTKKKRPKLKVQK